MVVDRVSEHTGQDPVEVDRLLHALSDATRRDILRRAVQGDLSVSRLAEAYPMSFAAVQKHVAVLEGVGLVTKQRHGRELRVQSVARTVDRARQALDELAETWHGRIGRMNDLLDAPEPSHPATPTEGQ